MPPKTRSRSTSALVKSNSSLRRVGAGVVLAPLKSVHVQESGAGQARKPIITESQAEPSCESQAGRMAVGSGVLAARQLRKSASSSQLRPVSSPRNCSSPQKEHQDPQPAMKTYSGELQACPICLDDLSGRPLGVCLGKDGRRSCQHYFHLDCLRKVEGARCPQCRTRFYNRAPLPNILEDSDSWCRCICVSGEEGAPSIRDVSEAFKAMLKLPSDAVDALVESCWHTWTRGSEFLSPDRMHEVIATISEYLPDRMSQSGSSTLAFADDDSVKLEDGHTRSGVVCSCGQIHVRRGDRVKRGPMPLDIDELDVIPGQLGTIVRIGQGQESVTVKWDRCPGEKVHSYTWPDPERNVLAPASFKEVADDVLELQKQTGLSSAAAEQLLHTEEYANGTAYDLYFKEGVERAEMRLRKPLRLFHRARILPDKLLVQQMYDRIPPCQCTSSHCSGGVQWSSRADKHLGREAMVLKIDSDDDTVLVETQGPCNCQIWYPKHALEPVYDPDLNDKLQFEENDHVECRMRDGWEKGVVREVLWQGPNRKGPGPYAVTLDNGSNILVPHVSLIRAAHGSQS